LFQAYNGTNYYLFITDGSVSGTKQLSTTILPDLSAGGVEAGGKFYFSGYEPAYGTELYKTDGTTGGTKLVKDIYPGSSSSYPSNFAAVGNTVYCTALEDTHGRELWKTTGNASSTKLVKDIVPGVGGLSIQDITGAAGKLFFINNNELWMSDGSSGGTHAINDPGLANIQYMDYMIAAGNKLFIAGYDYNYGTELFEGDASASNFAANAVAKTLNTTGLTAKLINNPFVNDLNIEVNSPVKQQLTISVSNAAGLPVASKVMDVSQGTNLITLPAASWSHGIYFININSSAGNVGLKAMK
jgi:ELWxxDGT repeat protein